MKVAVGLLTWNRKAMFVRTLASITRTAHPFDLVIVDNGSNDGTEVLVEEIGGYMNLTGNHTAGYGMNLAINQALRFGPDIVVFSADDYEYREGWLERLTAFWLQAPDTVILACCNLEPEYGWNVVRESLQVGDEVALVRASVPGSSWTFRARDWPLIGPVRDATGGEDLEICYRLTGRGFTLCALDLAEHIGERKSSWGNGSWATGQPLDRQRWGLL